MTKVIRYATRSGSFYPITMFYIAAVAVTAMVVRGWLTLVGAATLLALVAILVVLVATWRELRTVHESLDGQRTEMMARIDELTELLQLAGVTPPPPGPKEREARAEVEIIETVTEETP